MRGIGEGQTVTLLVIPEVQQLMRRQLSKAGYEGGCTAVPSSDTASDFSVGAGVTAERAALLDATAWLVVNSMKTERLQFDQLCHQNLSNLWRANAFEQALDGHRKLRVPASATCSYVLDMLGEAFVSNREGHVSRAKIEGKVIALFFRSSSRDQSRAIDVALRKIYDSYHGGKGVAFEVIQVDEATTPEAFVHAFREAPWLAIPVSHQQRRRALRKLFEVDESASAVVLLNQEGQTITRDGAAVLELALSCTRALERKEKLRKEIDKDKAGLLKEQESYANLTRSLEPVSNHIREAKAALLDLKPAELREIDDFLAEPAASSEAQAAMEGSEAALAEAQKKLRALSTGDLDLVRTTDAPSHALKTTVEALAILFEMRPDFALAQSRLMRTTEAMRRRLLGYQTAQIPKSAPARVRAFLAKAQTAADATAPGATVASVLGEWALATLNLDEATCEARLSVEEVQCSPTMAAACEAVCDLFGLQNSDDDLKGALQLAAAMEGSTAAAVAADDAKSASLSTAAPTDDVADSEAGLAALQTKVYRLKQFSALLTKDLQGQGSTVEGHRYTMASYVDRLNDRNGFAALLNREKADEVTRLVATLLIGLLFPDQMTKVTEGGQDAIEVAAKAIVPTGSRSSFDTFIGKARNLEPEISEGRSTLQDFSEMQSLSEQLAERSANHRWRTAQMLASNVCSWINGTVKYYAGVNQIASMKAQAASMKVELEGAQKACDEAEAASAGASGVGTRDGVSAMQLKAVREEAGKRGTAATADAARWALKRTAGNETSAVALLIAQPEASAALAALRSPGAHLLSSEAQLAAISSTTIRRVRNNLRKEGVRQLAEACGKGGQPSDNEVEALSDLNASQCELCLFKWVVAVCDYVEASMRMQPQHQKVMLLERRVEEKETALASSLADQRKDAAKAAAQLELPIDLFPPLAPWKHFPWEAHFLPRSEAEESLRAAVGLRDLAMLRTQLPTASAAGLSMRNSRVFFEASELSDSLEAQQAMTDASAVAAAKVWAPHKSSRAADHKSAPAAAAATEAQEDEDEPRSPLRGASASELNTKALPFFPAPPPIVREKTVDTLERVGRALDVFVEPVSTAVPSGLPKPRPFVDVLAEKAQSFDHFLQRGADRARRDAILSIVSHAVGVSDIETEQCREQEQEKAQEQEQEQEIEMERYVDMAYQRDGEEPRRWAFCTLAEAANGERLNASTAAPEGLAPFGAGSFYQARDFRLYGRAPLPFPPCLAVSRNHFNLEWVGERRLKNAVMVLEWVPSVSALRRVPPAATKLSEAQSAKLSDALKLLDTSGEGSYGRAQLAQLLRAAEHEEPSKAALDLLLREEEGCEGAEPKRLSYEETKSVLRTGALRHGDLGRHYVLLSLAEAETIRCILHMRQGKELVPGSDVALALRCIPAHDAVFDQTAGFPTATAYQGQIAHQSFRFLDSHMHYRPAELNALLRSLPAPPAARRLFFATVVACRRRLAKRWEQTPLAKLFTLEDEWSLLKLEAMRVHVRAAIRRRGLLLHDAFLLFDQDDDGLLSLTEVCAALTWLGLPSVATADVISLVRSLSQQPQLPYAAFIELLAPPDQLQHGNERGDSAELGAGAATLEADGGLALLAPEGSSSSSSSSAAVCPTVTSPAGFQDASAAAAAQAESLEAAWTAGVLAERALDEQLEKQMEEQAEAARRLVEAQLLDSDFSWMRTCKAEGGRNPRTTRTSCSYDFTRGIPGTQKGAPLWMEGRGRWFHVRQGSARVPCIKGRGGAFLVLRVPFRKSGGGTFCNTWTLSAMVKFQSVSMRGLLSTAGWDQFTQLAEGDDEAQLVMNGSGAIGAHGVFGCEGGIGAEMMPQHVRANTWHALSISVDAVAGVIHTYIDGVPASAVKVSKICKDGQDALKGRLALFYGKRLSGDYYLRQATVHNRALDASQVAKEHAMLHTLLMDDAVFAVPAALRPTIMREHQMTSVNSLLMEVLRSTAGDVAAGTCSLLDGDAALPASAVAVSDGSMAVGGGFSTPESLKQRVIELRASGRAKADELWRSLRLLASSAGATTAGSELMQGVQPHDMAVGARWAWSQSVIEESDEPFGETLLHAAAHVGHLALVNALIDNGADSARVGAVSSMTPLHAAAASGHTAVCLRLLQAGASVSALSSAGKRSALHLACARGHTETAKALVEVGGADPYLASSGGESAIGLLRRMGSAEALALLAELDGLCGVRAAADDDITATAVKAASGAVAESHKGVGTDAAAARPEQDETEGRGRDDEDDELRYDEGCSDDDGDGESGGDSECDSDEEGEEEE